MSITENRNLKEGLHWRSGRPFGPPVWPLF